MPAIITINPAQLRAIRAQARNARHLTQCAARLVALLDYHSLPPEAREAYRDLRAAVLAPSQLRQL